MEQNSGALKQMGKKEKKSHIYERGSTKAQNYKLDVTLSFQNQVK